MKRTNIVWIVALALGWLFDFLFWKHAQGINFAIYAGLCLSGGFLVLGLNGIKPSWKSLLLLVPILFFAAMTFIRQEPVSIFLAFAFTLALMGLLAFTYLGGRWLWYSLSDYVINYGKLTGSMIARPLIFLNEIKKPVPAEVAEARPGRKRFWAILRGVLIAIPIVAIFAALLSSADLVFAQRVQGFVKLFRLENFPEYIFRCIYILIGAYALTGTILHAAQKSQDENLVGMDKPLVPSFLGFTEAAVVLGAVVVLFALFAVVQFQYFFGGQTNIGVQGYTFSEYARRGFGELVTVAFFSLLLFLSLSAVVKRQNQTQRWVFSGLGLGMVALVGVMLYSAFQRMMLYEAAYGFSRLRAYTHVFMIWLGVLLVVVVVLDILRKERTFALAALLASIGFAATLTLMNVDGFIVRQNVARAAAGADLDVAYLASLSSDSVPALVESLQDGRLTPGTRDAVGAALACRLNAENGGNADTNWRSFTLSRLWADQAMGPTQVQEILINYAILDENWPVQVQTPMGEKYDCSTDGMN
ncbi:MAG: DUF4173 domain-containing protein [Anaerolineales bacterium]|nr:DUF4173 domain-containing protein [Anaerolineales bacterium]